MKLKYDTESIIKKFKEKHGDKYDYSRVDFVSTRERVVIICPIHGEFTQTPSGHLSNGGCNECGRESSIKKRSKTNDDFIKEAKKTHGNTYDYSLVDYVSCDVKVTITCKEHGDFTQTPSHHLNGQGCPKCRYIKSGNTNRKSSDWFKEKASDLHRYKYDYSMVEYIGDRKKTCIICPIHGEFWQRPNNHINKHLLSGCPMCGRESTVNSRKQSKGGFIKKSNEIHSYKYDYSLVNFKDVKTKVKILCPTHGEFEQSPANHMSGQGCKKCFMDKSNIERELYEFIKEIYNGEVIENNRSLLDGLELDIYLPKENLAFEMNGLNWHSEKFQTEKTYHLNKTIKCNKKGVRLIQIFEDEWISKKEIIKSMIKNIFKLNEEKIYARNCHIKEITTKDARDFINLNHIQGNVNSKIKIGLFHEGNLISVMTFCSERVIFGKSQSDGNYELLRYCSLTGVNVVGGPSKLLSYFIKTYNPKNIVSYADRRWSQGDLYKKLGFDFIRNSKINYYYILGKKRINRFNFRKDILVKDGYDQNMSEHEIMLSRKIYRIYDCGCMVFNKKLK